MVKKFFILLVLVALALSSWSLNTHFVDVDLDKILDTFVVLITVYIIFRVILEEAIGRRIKESKTRYSFRKVVSFLFWTVSIIVVIRIWVPNPEALLVAYGLLAAGVAIALQDLFKNLAGGISVFFTRPYEVGNRIEINGVLGDVIDIGLFYTTLLEIREWVQGDQATGRITHVPNGYILSGVLKNYTKDHNFLWDEISITVTGDSDWKHGMQLMVETASAITEEFSKEAKKSLSHLEKRYYLEDRKLEPNAYLGVSPDGHLLSVRYVVAVRERRRIHTELLGAIMEAFEAEPSIAVAPKTFASVEFPKVSKEKE